jgi:hypothetical protein
VLYCNLVSKQELDAEKCNHSITIINCIDVCGRAVNGRRLYMNCIPPDAEVTATFYVLSLLSRETPSFYWRQDTISHIF